MEDDALAQDMARWDASQGRTDVMTEAGFGPPVEVSKLAMYRKQLPVFLRKNKGLATDPEFWRLLPRLRAVRAQAQGHTEGQPLLWVGTHHKAMTTYFNAVLRFFAYATRLKFEKISLEQPAADTRLFLSNHSKMELPSLAPYRGIHLMRDPRDMIVSGYHYHKWTNETWVHRPDDQGRSYQQKMQAADTRTGLFMEIDHFIFFYREQLENWDMDNPDILEVPYEDLMGEGRDQLYHDIFAHFGVPEDQAEIGVELMRLFEAKRRTGRNKDAAQAKHQHIRSGRKEQWREELSPEHLDYIEVQLGPVLRKFDYDPH
ncbi:sulfotransferase domain-containing protein [Gymnodinialimonas sp. 2307UL20-7]